METTIADVTTLTYDYSGRDAYGELIARREYDDETGFYQFDALGSAMSLLDAAEGYMAAYRYGLIPGTRTDIDTLGKFG